MRITFELFTSVLPDKTPNDAKEITRLIGLIGRFYCSRMNTSGYCTRDCFNCEERLREALTLKNTKPGDTTGLIVYRLKNAFAAEQDAHADHKAVEVKTIFGATVTTNGFDDFLGTL